MTYVRITINDSVEFDGSVDEWLEKTPDMFRDQIKADATPKPHMMAIMVTMAAAVTQQKSTVMDVTTRSNRWEMKVEYP